MAAAVLAIPILGILALALMGKKEKKPAAVVVAPEAEGEPMVMVDTDSGEAVAVPTEDVDELAEAIDEGDEEAIADALDTTGGVKMPPEFPTLAKQIDEEDREPEPELPTPREAGPLQQWQIPPALRELPGAEEVIETVEEMIPEVMPPPEPMPPPPVAVPVAEPVPADTAALASRMIREEGAAGWKYIDEEVRAWQSARQLVADGKYGPGSAGRMATEIGVLPIVRYWPRSAIKSRAVPGYREILDALADESPEPRASALRASAMREEGQSFGTTRGAALTDELSASWREMLARGQTLGQIAAMIAAAGGEA